MSSNSDVSSWQNIETAPRDGTVVDLWVTNMFGEGACRCADCFWNGSQWKPVHFAWFFEQESVTHWMPIPPPPEGGQE